MSIGSLLPRGWIRRRRWSLRRRLPGTHRGRRRPTGRRWSPPRKSPPSGSENIALSTFLAKLAAVHDAPALFVEFQVETHQKTLARPAMGFLGAKDNDVAVGVFPAFGLDPNKRAAIGREKVGRRVAEAGLVAAVAADRGLVNRKAVEPQGSKNDLSRLHGGRVAAFMPC